MKRFKIKTNWDDAITLLLPVTDKKDDGASRFFEKNEGKLVFISLVKRSTQDTISPTFTSDDVQGGILDKLKNVPSEFFETTFVPVTMEELDD